MGRLVEYLVNIALSRSRFSRLLLQTCAADRLPSPFGPITRDPPISMIVGCSTYGVFMVIWLPLYLLSFAVTSGGSALLLLGIIGVSGAELTRTLSFPGCSPAVIREVEKEYTKTVAVRLTSWCDTISAWVQMVQAPNIPSPRRHQFRTLHEEVQRLCRRGPELSACEEHYIGPRERSSAEEIPCSGEFSVFLAAVEASLRELSHRGPRASVNGDDVERGNLPSAALQLDNPAEVAPTEDTPPPKTHAECHQAALRSTQRLYKGLKNVHNLVIDICERRIEVTRARSPTTQENREPVGETLSSLTGRLQLEVEGLRNIATSLTCIEHAPVNNENANTSTNASSPLQLMKGWWGSYKPYTKASGFGLMRHEVLKRSGAEQMWITMKGGTRIDCCHLKTSTGQTAKGCVMLCNPNAGYYETMLASAYIYTTPVVPGTVRMDWTMFYRQLGYDVLIWNYRGYGRSTGVPTPKRLKADASEIVNYILEKGLTCRVILHGESIGGMVAAGAASICKDKVEMLILDRTFSSLTAAAHRLMGGWTQAAIACFTGWSKSTDTAADYMSCTCHKLIACDPEDGIIHDTASVKVGVALRHEFGARPFRHGSYPPPKLPDAYRIADKTGSVPPTREPILPSICSPGSSYTAFERFTPAAVNHFSACVRDVGRRAKLLTRKIKADKTPRNGHTGTHTNDINIHRREVSAPSGLEMITLSEESGFGSDDDSSDGSSSSSSEESSSENSSGKPLGSIAEDGGGVYRTDIPLSCAWYTLARLDGLCGRLLGRAACRGYDDVRAWVCSLAVFGSRRISKISLDSSSAEPSAAQSADTPEGCVEPLQLSCVIHELQKLIENHPAELHGDTSLAYVVKFLSVLQHRVNSGPKSSPDDPKSFSDDPKRHPESSVNNTHVNICSKEDELLGYLLPLRCGHNNMYDNEELGALRKFLELGEERSRNGPRTVLEASEV